jgi:multimeric flavodoxin WrbA
MGREMKNFVWEEDVKGFLENFLEYVARIIQPIWREKVTEECYRIAEIRGVEKISKEILFEAIRDRIPHDYAPLVSMIEDPERFQKEFIGMYADMEAYNRIPVEIKRWDSPFHAEKVKPSRKPEETTVLAFNASPRKGGNTDILIDKALEGARNVGARTEKHYIQDLKMGYCIGCHKCKAEIPPDTCVVKDDLTPLYGRIRQAQCIIIGFPIYNARESGQLAVFLDRWACFEGPGFTGTLEPGKRAMVIGTWGYPKIDTYDYHIQRVIGVLNMYKVQTVEAISASGFEGLLHGLDENKRGIVLRNPEGLMEVFEAGKFLVMG